MEDKESLRGFRLKLCFWYGRAKTTSGAENRADVSNLPDGEINTGVEEPCSAFIEIIRGRCGNLGNILSHSRWSVPCVGL